MELEKFNSLLFKRIEELKEFKRIVNPKDTQDLEMFRIGAEWAFDIIRAHIADKVIKSLNDN